MKEGVTVMDLQWETTLFAIIAFGLLYWLLSKYAFGPLFSVMEKRSALVQEQMEQAQTDRTEASALLTEQKQAYENARKEAYDILEQARATSNRQTDEMISQAKSESDRIKQDALREIEEEKNKAVAALRSQVSAMSVMIASKIIEKQVDEKAQHELIDEYLSKAGGGQ
jgi:F-type H+-transporting ATPase subunit b